MEPYTVSQPSDLPSYESGASPMPAKETFWKRAWIAGAAVTVVTLTAALIHPSPFFLAACAVASLATGVLFAIEAARSFFSKATQEKILGKLRGGLREFGGFLTIIPWYFRDLTKQNPVKVGENSGDPLLLVHGLWHNSSAFVRYTRWLKEKGVGPVFTLNLPATRKTVESNAPALKEKVDEIRRLSGGKPVTVIGHSMGGLVASWVATEPGEEGIKAVITLGSPLQGTTMAYLSPTKSAKQMRRGSEFVKELEKRIDGCRGVIFHHFGSTLDELIIPQASAVRGKKGGEGVTVLPNVGHVAYLTSRNVFDKVMEVVEGVNDPLVV